MHVGHAARTMAVLSLLALALQQALVARWRATGADVAAPGEAAADTQLRAADAGAEPSQADPGAARAPERAVELPVAGAHEAVAAARGAGVPSAAADDPEARPDRFTARASPRSVIGEVRRAPRAGDGRRIMVNLGLPKSGTSSLHELLAHNYSLPSAHCDCHSWSTPPEVRRIVNAFLARFKEELGAGAWCGPGACAVRFNALQWHDAQQQQQQQSRPPTSSLLPLAFAPDTVAFTEINCFSSQAAFVPQATGLVRLLTAYSPGELVLVLTSRDDREWAQSVRRWYGMGSAGPLVRGPRLPRHRAGPHGCRRVQPRGLSYPRGVAG